MYRGQPAGGPSTEDSFDLNDLSTSLQNRSFDTNDYELKNILDWAPISKSGKDTNLTNQSKMRDALNSAFDTSNSTEDRINALCELKGFNVQAAGAILTAHSPSDFGFITHGSIKALAVEDPYLADPTQYNQFAKFTDWIRYLPYRPSIYEEYINIFQKIWPKTPSYKVSYAFIEYKWVHG